MAITRKLRQKVCDGSLREMRQEAKWIFAYIRRYRAAVGIHILLGILGTALSLLSSVAMKTLIDVVTGFETGAIWSAAAWMAGLLLAPDCGVTPGQIIAALAEHNIEARHIWKPMHLQPVFRDCAFVKTAERSVAEDVFARGVCLPSDTKMTPEQQAQVCAVIRGLF